MVGKQIVLLIVSIKSMRHASSVNVCEMYHVYDVLDEGLVFYKNDYNTSVVADMTCYTYVVYI